MMKPRRKPSYLRVVVTKACALSCAFCHEEGMAAAQRQRGLSLETLQKSMAVAVRAGVRKFKFLGGEPLLRKDLPLLIAHLKQISPNSDISLITAGAAPNHLLRAVFEAGLDRANCSIHGWSPDAFAANGGDARLWLMRQINLQYLVELGRPLKLNYVYTGAAFQREDLQALLDWAADRPVVVNVLDELGDTEMNAQTIMKLLHELRGPWEDVDFVPDPDSLSTHHLRWRDGLQVEVKTEQLGELAPWSHCSDCFFKARCREGIYALRLTPDGHLRLCMDRPDVELPLAALVEEDIDRAWWAWERFLDEHMGNAMAGCA